MSFLVGVLIFHNLTLPNASGHFELSFEISLLNHAWIRTSRLIPSPAILGSNMALDLRIQLAGGVTLSLVLIDQIPTLHLKDGGELIVQTAGHVLFAAKPCVRQSIPGFEARPQSTWDHVPYQLMFGLLLGSAHIPSRRTALVPKGFVLGFVDGALLPHDQLGLNRQKALGARQPQLQHLMPDPVPTLGMVKITTGAFDLAPGAGFAAVIHHESGVGAATHLIGLINPPAQLTV
jgi:hypothetical protein